MEQAGSPPKADGRRALIDRLKISEPFEHVGVASYRAADNAIFGGDRLDTERSSQGNQRDNTEKSWDQEIENIRLTQNDQKTRGS